MSNMSNDTLTPADEYTPQRRRRSPWRIFFALLCVAAGGWYAWHTAPPTIDSYEAARRVEVTNTVSPMVEALEQEISPPNLKPISELPQFTTSFFEENDTVAYVRLWNSKGEMLCEVSRLDSKTVLTSPQLPSMGARDAFQLAVDWTHDADWRKPIIDLRPLLLGQSNLSDSLQATMNSKTITPNTRLDLYLQQQSIYDSVDKQVIFYPELQAATVPINSILELLSGKEDIGNIKAAIDLSQTAETALSLALENRRLVFDETVALPQNLARQAPAGGMLSAIWTEVNARRVMAPIFGVAFGENPIPTAAVVEIGSFSRPYELWQSVALACWPSLIALLLAILFLVWPRHKTKKEKAMENYENPPFSFEK